MAARRMGASRAASARLVGFLSNAGASGARAALKQLNLEVLAGRPIQEIFLGLADYVCPNSGTVDEAIARNAFIETVADLTGLGLTDLDSLTEDQIQTVLELFGTHAIEARICNDIGANLLTFPVNLKDAETVQQQLRDFIRRGVSDALAKSRKKLEALTPERVGGFIEEVYELAFSILESLGEEAEAQ